MKQRQAFDGFSIGCAGLLLLFALGYCAVHDESPKSPEEKKQAVAETAKEAAEKAENKRKGFHCLSAWDGSSRQFVDAVKEQLRDPDSFEHIETRIAPVDEKGMHAILMKYRARNGFGGMNVETALGTVRNSDCSATLIGSQ